MFDLDNDEKVLLALIVILLIVLIVVLSLALSYDTICQGLGYQRSTGWPSPGLVECEIKQSIKLVDILGM